MCQPSLVETNSKILLQNYEFRYHWRHSTFVTKATQLFSDYVGGSEKSLWFKMLRRAKSQ